MHGTTVKIIENVFERILKTAVKSLLFPPFIWKEGTHKTKIGLFDVPAKIKA
jgi:hypothetical protein